MARAAERAGISTVAVGQNRGLMSRIKYPRSLVTPFERGQTMGPPGDPETHRRVLASAFALLSAGTAGEMRILD